MSAKKTKIKKNRKRITKKNAGLIILMLKFFKVFKITFTIFILLVVIYFFSFLYKNSVFTNFITDIKFIYSKTLYKNICSNVEINGVDKSNIYNIQDKIYNFCSLEDKNDLNSLLNKLKQDPWIKNINIKRILPNTLEITIDEYLPFAIWKNDENIELINEQGTTININEREKRGYYNLLAVMGDGSKENIYSLFNILSSNPSLFSRIRSAIRVGKRRWDFILDNNIIVKMPEENNLLDAWDRLDKILSIRGSEINLKTIDLRNSDKAFLEENN
ncbi:MAG: cell division protein FtsQ/DivIB [Rickettsiales bacterium]|nr:cell division protein FtsQ/DivIB [Rickettsiales bacterium]